MSKPAKNNALANAEILCRNFGRHGYEWRRQGRTDFGRLVADPNSPHVKGPKPVDAVGAFKAWMNVLSLYRDWSYARDAARNLQLKEEGEPVDFDVAEYRYRARPLKIRARALEKALRQTTESFGDLGVGASVRTIAHKLGDVQNYVIVGDQLAKWSESGTAPRGFTLHDDGRFDGELPKSLVDRLTKPDKRLDAEVLAGIVQVGDTVEALTPTSFYTGRLRFKVEHMFEAVVLGAMVAPHTGNVIQCSECLTLFASSRSDKKTCSERCRKRRSARQ